MAFSAEDVRMFLETLPEEVPFNPGRQNLINNAGKLPKLQAQVLVGLFPAAAFFAVASRTYIQIARRGRLFADDYLIIVALCALMIETALWYHMSGLLWMIVFLSENPQQHFILFGRRELLAIFKILDLHNVYFVFCWLTNYGVKLSFLVFFRVLIHGVSGGLNRYWWFVLVITVVSWLFNSIETIATCGVGASMKCFPYNVHNLEIAGATTAVDILTDVLIVSIPFFLLRKSRLRFGQKFRILIFLCLSIVMVGFAFARLAGSLHHDISGVLTLDITWTLLWLHLESSVAVLMGGLTAFRIVFANQVREAGHRKTTNTAPVYKRFTGFLIKSSGRHSSEYLKSRYNKQNGLLADPVTGGTLKGLRTFIRRNGREEGQPTMDGADNSILVSKYDQLESYHHYMKDIHSEGVRKSTSDWKGDPEIQSTELPSRPQPVFNAHNMA